MRDLICWLIGHRWRPVTVALNREPEIATGDVICVRCYSVRFAE